jgi:cytochrome d ubiquinol oxidase subunit I
MGPSGFAAVLAGWITTEVGRQPWTVQGLLTTAQSASPIDAAAVGASLIAFVIVYFALFGAGTFYILRLMNQPAHGHESGLPPEQPIRAGGIMPGPVMAAKHVLPAAE